VLCCSSRRGLLILFGGVRTDSPSAASRDWSRWSASRAQPFTYNMDACSAFALLLGHGGVTTSRSHPPLLFVFPAPLGRQATGDRRPCHGPRAKRARLGAGSLLLGGGTSGPHPRGRGTVSGSSCLWASTPELLACASSAFDGRHADRQGPLKGHGSRDGLMLSMVGNRCKRAPAMNFDWLICSMACRGAVHPGSFRASDCRPGHRRRSITAPLDRSE